MPLEKRMALNIRTEGADKFAEAHQDFAEATLWPGLHFSFYPLLICHGIKIFVDLYSINRNLAVLRGPDFPEILQIQKKCLFFPHFVKQWGERNRLPLQHNKKRLQ